jgi:uncharacterized protein (TIGR02246 family)
MKRLEHTIGFTLVAMNLVMVQTSRAAETSAEEVAIRQSARAFVEAFDEGRAEAVAALWTEDAEYIVGSTTVKGRSAIARLYDQFFRAHPGSQMEINVESIQVLAPTVAIEQGTTAVANSPNGPPSASAYTAVHVKQGDKWLMASVRESPAGMSAQSQDLQSLAWMIGAWAAWGDAANVEANYDWLTGNNFLRGETSVKSNDGSTAGALQIIGKDPLTGQIVSWFFNADGSHGYGEWTKNGSRWLIRTQGVTADGAPTIAVNILYHPDDRVLSWRSIDRMIGDQSLPNTPEVVIDRVSGSGTTSP